MELQNQSIEHHVPVIPAIVGEIAMLPEPAVEPVSQLVPPSPVVQEAVDQVKVDKAARRAEIERKKRAVEARRHQRQMDQAHARAEKERKLAEREAAKKEKELAKDRARLQRELEREMKDKQAQQARSRATPGTRSVNNGVARPHPNSKSGQVWAICDDVSVELGVPAPRDKVTEIGLNARLHPTTIKAQYFRWRRYHELPGLKQLKHDLQVTEQQ